MTKKEIKLIKDTIADFERYLTDEEFAKDLSEIDVIDLEARQNVLQWLLEATGNL